MDEESYCRINDNGDIRYICELGQRVCPDIITNVSCNYLRGKRNAMLIWRKYGFVRCVDCENLGLKRLSLDEDYECCLF